MARASEHAEEDEACRHRGVQNAEENDGWNHKSECDLLVHLVRDRAECGCRHVLCTGVRVYNATNAAEDNDLSNGDAPESLGEILGSLHLCNEAGKCNLPNECVANVHECVHTSNKGSTRGHNGVDFKLAHFGVTRGLLTDSREDGCQQDGDEGEQSGEGGDLGQRRERPWKRGDERDDRGDCSETNGAQLVASDSVPPLGAYETVQTHDERVVQDEHDRGKVECPFLVPEDHLAQITHIANLGVAHAEVPKSV